MNRKKANTYTRRRVEDEKKDYSKEIADGKDSHSNYSHI
jgi:hypothetical protein